MSQLVDPVLRAIVRTLQTKFKCHTVVLYGSRARGLHTETSDYDVMGIRKSGPKTRIAKYQNGFYWDVFVYSEKDLVKFESNAWVWKNPILIFEKNDYGKNFLRRLSLFFQRPFRPLPQFEIKALKVWSQKEMERCKGTGIQALFRRSEFQAAMIEHYFSIRKKRFYGPKEGFAWLKKNDPQTYKKIERALKNPSSLSALQSAASRVYRK